MTSYDIIGDVLGHADSLSALLGKMGYVHARGAFANPRAPPFSSATSSTAGW